MLIRHDVAYATSWRINITSTLLSFYVFIQFEIVFPAHFKTLCGFATHSISIYLYRLLKFCHFPYHLFPLSLRVKLTLSLGLPSRLSIHLFPTGNKIKAIFSSSNLTFIFLGQKEGTMWETYFLLNRYSFFIPLPFSFLSLFLFLLPSK